MQPDDVIVRPFAASEWELYKAVRLKALASDPHVFGSSLEKEKGYADDRWQNTVANPDVGVFGVFHQSAVIGMTGVVIKREKPADATLWGSWLEKEWRGKGLSRKMYEARIDWARRHPEIHRIVVSHRKSNQMSKAANQKHGFVWTHDSDKVWNDTVNEPECHYELRVR